MISLRAAPLNLGGHRARVPNSHRSLRDGSYLAIFQAINCLATFIQSLRDKSTPRLSLLMFLNPISVNPCSSAVVLSYLCAFGLCNCPSGQVRSSLTTASQARHAPRLPKMIVASPPNRLPFFLRETSDAGKRQIGESLVPLAF